MPLVKYCIVVHPRRGCFRLDFCLLVDIIMKTTYISDNVLEEFYKGLMNGSSRRVHIPRSEVFHTRTHLEQVFKQKFSLDYVERCMFLEGLLDKKDVFEPDRIRPWEQKIHNSTNN